MAEGAARSDECFADGTKAWSVEVWCVRFPFLLLREVVDGSFYGNRSEKVFRGRCQRTVE